MVWFNIRNCFSFYSCCIRCKVGSFQAKKSAWYLNYVSSFKQPLHDASRVAFAVLLENHRSNKYAAPRHLGRNERALGYFLKIFGFFITLRVLLSLCSAFGEKVRNTDRGSFCCGVCFCCVAGASFFERHVLGINI